MTRTVRGPAARGQLSPELLASIAELSQVVAIKNSTGDLRRFLDVFFALKDRVRIFGAPRNELGIALVKDHGADGMMGAGAVLGHRIRAGDLQRGTETARCARRLPAAPRSCGRRFASWAWPASRRASVSNRMPQNMQ